MTVAAALVGPVLETVLGALGVTNALERATIESAEWVRALGDQLRETLPALVTPALLGTQITASLIILNEASERLEGLLRDPSLPHDLARQPEQPRTGRDPLHDSPQDSPVKQTSVPDTRRWRDAPDDRWQDLPPDDGMERPGRPGRD